MKKKLLLLSLASVFVASDSSHASVIRKKASSAGNNEQSKIIKTTEPEHIKREVSEMEEYPNSTRRLNNEKYKFNTRHTIAEESEAEVNEKVPALARMNEYEAGVFAGIMASLDLDVATTPELVFEKVREMVEENIFLKGKLEKATTEKEQISIENGYVREQLDLYKAEYQYLSNENQQLREKLIESKQNKFSSIHGTISSIRKQYEEEEKKAAKYFQVYAREPEQLSKEREYDSNIFVPQKESVSEEAYQNLRRTTNPYKASINKQEQNPYEMQDSGNTQGNEKKKNKIP